MDNKVLVEIVAAHADQLREGQRKAKDYLAMFPDYQEKLKPLLDTAEKVQWALKPVEPDPAFCQSLYEDLLAMARRKMTGEVPQSAKSHRKQLIIGAAALGSVISVAGAFAYLIRSRAADTRSASAA